MDDGRWTTDRSWGHRVLLSIVHAFGIQNSYLSPYIRRFLKSVKRKHSVILICYSATRGSTTTYAPGDAPPFVIRSSTLPSNRL